MTIAPTPQEQILGIVNNHWQSRCVGVAAQLELADHLANGPLHVDVLAERTQTHAPSLFRMLRALESTGFCGAVVTGCLRQHTSERLPAPPRSRVAMEISIRICLCPDSFVEDGWRALLLAVKNGADRL